MTWSPSYFTPVNARWNDSILGASDVRMNRNHFNSRLISDVLDPCMARDADVALDLIDAQPVGALRVVGVDLDVDVPALDVRLSLAVGRKQPQLHEKLRQAC